MPNVSPSTWRESGAEDVAIRRGQHYGTLIIDCETGAPLDLLEGRDAQPLTAGPPAPGRGPPACRRSPRNLGWGLHTIQRYDLARTWQELAEDRWPADRASKLDPFKPYPDQHADGGHGSFTRLFHENRALGYDGSYSLVRNYLDRQRPAKAPLR